MRGLAPAELFALFSVPRVSGSCSNAYVVRRSSIRNVLFRVYSHWHYGGVLGTRPPRIYLPHPAEVERRPPYDVLLEISFGPGPSLAAFVINNDFYALESTLGILSRDATSSDRILACCRQTRELMHSQPCPSPYFLS